MKLITLILAFLLASTSLSAAVLKVTTEADSGPGSLRERVATAHNGDTIKFANCVKSILLLSEITLSVDLEISGPDVTLRGGNENRIFQIINGAHIVLNELELMTGFSSTGGGAVLVNTGSSLNVDKCTFAGNRVNQQGGAILFASQTSGVITDSQFNGNSSQADGGAIFANAQVSLNIDNTCFMGNSAGSGGAIRNGGNLKVHNGHFTQNKASNDAGAVYNDTGASADFVLSKFIENVSRFNRGGAIVNLGSMTIAHALFERNVAQAGDGGALFNQATLNIDNSSFKANTTATKGGALFNNTASATINVQGSRFKNNSARVDGEAICNNGGTLIQNNLFFEGNTPNDIAP